MAKPNYSFEKRQRELEKKRKKAEKMARRNAAAPTPEPIKSDATLADPAPQKDD